MNHNSATFEIYKEVVNIDENEKCVQFYFENAKLFGEMLLIFWVWAVQKYATKKVATKEPKKKAKSEGKQRTTGS